MIDSDPVVSVTKRDRAFNVVAYSLAACVFLWTSAFLVKVYGEREMVDALRGIETNTRACAAALQERAER